MNNIIAVENLTKIYNGQVKAVDNISFSVKEGEVFGFLGPNGAGKTTTIKVLTTLLRKTSGKAFVSSYEVDHNPMAIRRIIGYTAQDIEIDGDMTGRENLVLAGRLYRLPRKKVKARTEELLEVMGLTDAAGRLAGTYSGGMRKRLDLATVLVHEPQVLFLDEPTTGLDPQSRFALWQYLEKINKEGATIFLTTQYMEEADRLCQKLAIIDLGKIVAEGEPKKLKAEIGGDTVTIEIKGEVETAKSYQAKARAALEKVTDVSAVKPLDDNRVVLYVKNGGLVIPEIISLLNNLNIPLGPLSFSESTLDDVFLKYTGRELRVEEEKRKSRMQKIMRGRA
ncbi:MAG TPA: ATP-binding cassette domain-containing protein [Candidatus Subteraquimicrobiales bacterium]